MSCCWKKSERTWFRILIDISNTVTQTRRSYTISSPETNNALQHLKLKYFGHDTAGKATHLRFLCREFEAL